MKKLFVSIIASAMMVSLFTPWTNAVEDRTFVQVKYVEDDQITIDGNISASEWDETSKLTLSATGEGASKLKKWMLNDVSDIQFYYSWGDKGLYMAAKIIDSTPASLAPDENGYIDPGLRGRADHFQIGLNPMGLIADEFSGLFFSFVRLAMEDGATVGNIMPVAHYWQEGYYGCPDEPTRFNEGDLAGYGVDFEGKYTETAEGWNMELLLPMDLIASELRTYDLDVEVGSSYSLSTFDPKGENRALAWASAMITYIDCEVVTDEYGYKCGVPIGTGRTVLDGVDGSDWGVSSYPLALKFNLKNQTPDEIIETLGKNTPSQSVKGDYDGNGTLDENDASYLLMHCWFPESYPINTDADLDKNGMVDENDASYVLMHCWFPESYPLKDDT